eukprot:gene7833-9302_t
MLLSHNANILDENLTLDEITHLAAANISVNDSGSKTQTFFQDYSMFKKITDAKKLKAAEASPKPIRVITSPRSFTDCCTAFWTRSLTIDHINSMGGKADNLKAPSAVNSGRLGGKEDLYMKKAVKRYIDHCRWKEVSEVTDRAEDDEVEEQTPVADGSDDEMEMDVDYFALSDEEDEARDARRLQRKEERMKLEEFEARAENLPGLRGGMKGSRMNGK